jgi:drug/metabolite transporter (DMT)-like permease
MPDIPYGHPLSAQAQYNQLVMLTTMPTQDASLARRRRIQADASLLLVAMIWGTAFVAQRLAAMDGSVYLFNGLRFLLAALVLLPLAWRGDRGRSESATIDRRSQAGVLLAGLLLFLGATLQQAGLRYTTAGNAGFITGMYVIFIPIILSIGWKQKLRRTIWLAAGLSLAGLYLLSTSGAPLRQMSLNPGDILVFVSAIFWACHVILIDWLAQRLNVIRIALGQFLVCGSLSTLLGLWLEPGAPPTILDYWWVVLYTGAISAGLGYTLQVASQRYAPPADTAVILSLEAVFAALSGWLVLGEVLEPVQLLGCGIMFGGMLLSQAHLFRR